VVVLSKMATAKTLVLSASKSSKSHALEDLVAPRERLEVPNHIVDTSKYYLSIVVHQTTYVVMSWCIFDLTDKNNQEVACHYSQKV